MRVKKDVIMIFATIFVILEGFYFYFHLPMFGKFPKGERLARIEKSPNYKNGQFHNLHSTPMIAKNPSGTMLHFLFRSEKGLRPSQPLPSIKTDLKNLDIKEDLLVWFGHSSYLLQIGGKRILTDPLFSEVSSPVLFFPKAFPGTCVFKAEDMPELDYLIITHDHWDHLDYQTVLKLKDKTKKVICSLGIGETLEYWGFKKDQIIETDWGDEVVCSEKLTIYCLPSRHFSGRTLVRNKTLWSSFLFKSGDFKLYMSGDSGYDTHFSDICKKFGPMDIVILDSGQHNENWRYVHMLTPEVVQAAKDLQASTLIPMHICKVCLAYHSWDEPMEEILELMQKEKFFMFVPIIGEKVDLHSKKWVLNTWWRKIK